MNSIEDRLKEATQAAARTVADGSAPPLRLPEFGPRLLQLRPRGRAGRLLAPIGAAAAVAALAGTVVAVRGDLATDNTSAASAAAAVRAVPHYFVALAHPGRLRPRQPSTALALVGTTATGKIIARVNVPAPYNSFVAVSGAADDRTFVLAAQKRPTPPTAASLARSLGSPATRFYMLRIDPSGRQQAVLTPLPLPVLRAGYFGGAIALSPDGSRLAVPLDREQYHNSFYGIRVYDLSGGSYRTWFLPRRQASWSPPVISPSWDPDGSHLAVLVSSARPRACTPYCVQLLDTATPGGNVMTDSVTIFHTATVRRLISWSTSLLTTDGSRVLVAGMAGRKLQYGDELFNLPVVYEVSARSGQILSHLTGRDNDNLYPVWASSAARFFILTRSTGDVFGSISAAIYGPGARVPVRLPTRTLDAAW